MIHNIFETRERAKELLEEAVKIWKQSPQSESLEGLDKDPVMLLLITALAWQMNETDSEIERLKEEVVGEYVRMLTPYELGHAIPSTTVVETALKKGVAEWEVGENSSFKLSGSRYDYLPVLHTKVVNAEIRSIARLDGRRWKVSLGFGAPIQNLSGFCFAIKNRFFNDLKVTYKGYHIPLVKPWDYADLPLTSCFSLSAAVYNGRNTYNASMTGMDLFAQQNVRLFCVREHDATQYVSTPVEEMSLVFEFTGIGEGFEFDKRQFAINCIVLAEAQLNHTTLSVDRPLARVAGSGKTDKEETSGSQFLHMVSPSDESLEHEERVEVRKVSADRFNQGRLLRLLATLIDKYNSDFYAFSNHKDLADDGSIHALQDILERMTRICRNDKLGSTEGVYLMLHRTQAQERTSIEIHYLTTHGSAPNEMLNDESIFIPPAPLASDSCRQIASPMPGSNEVGDRLCEDSLMRYHILTNDRLITPADIKLFCRKELMTRYGIDSTLVKSILVRPRMTKEAWDCGYEIEVDILLADTPFVRRSFAEKVPQVELLLQKMIEMRSTQIYPVNVTIMIETKNKQ